MKKIFVTGTDTDVGKTIVSAGLCLTWPAHYWKPIQAGYECTPSHANSENTNNPAKLKNTTLQNITLQSSPNNHILPKTDNETLSRFIPAKNIHPSSYTLKNPLSPNQAGKLEDIDIQSYNINLPNCLSNLIIEGAGGVLVPFNDKEDMTDLIKKWDCPVIIVARSGLGTLNHTFLTLNVLKAKQISILGVILIGTPHPMNKKDISAKVPVLLELPFLETLSSEVLISHFQKMKLNI